MANAIPLKRSCINELITHLHSVRAIVTVCVGTVLMSTSRDEQWFKENIRCCWTAALMHFGNKPQKIWAGAQMKLRAVQKYQQFYHRETNPAI